MTTALCQHVAETIGQLYDCAEINNGFIRIRTPYLYPDGDIIDLYWKEKDGQQILTDLGETLRWLDGQTANQKLSKRQTQALEDIRLTHGIELYRGTLTLRIPSDASLADGLTRLAQAALRTADLWFLSRTRTTSSITDDVAEFLSEKRIRFEQDQTLLGRSGRALKIDFQTWHPRRTSFVEVLSTGSKAAANQKANNVLATWYDLSQYKVSDQPIRFVSLFDDTLDVWSSENFSLLQEFSDIAYWSRPDEFAELLVA
ncbi:hypothetical protein XM38_001160 [Halomicronema hongdechloris C2206]|uniref:DUF1828 domain-containing protein n=1 Tax=Halomicronema hongdechloris C2206 TaxID=1641165 RepID=A0A1Z3HFY1_9CYAN|nr:DUF1828 domain-containing protein [Halomicronema hongdechloris]ASC69190.1 hypothetical protein XM38_001160 [Halomicronema hongdechloris C2206]